MNMNDESSSMVLEKDWDKFPGHVMPATLYVGFGVYALLKTLQLAKELPPGRTLTETYIPFRDLSVVRNVGVAIMVFTILGALYHAAGEGIDASIRLHMTLYSSFFMVGLVAFLESKKRLMPDSGRASLALCLLLNSFIWRSHGMMMAATVNQNVHIYLGYICLADALVFGYSVMQKDSIIAHIVGWALMILQGLWLYFIAFYLCCIEVSPHMVEANLCGLTILLTIIIVLVVAFADLPHVRESHDNFSSPRDGRGEYEVLAKLNHDNCDFKSGGSEATLDSQSHDSGDELC